MYIGNFPWSREEMIDELQEFADLYAGRPIKDNTGGMNSIHMFYVWLVAKKMQPDAIIESGVWYGQGTWFFEKAAPNTKLYCIDPNPRYRNSGYASSKAVYFNNNDFSTIDWDNLGIDKRSTLCFFDDHQNAMIRLLDCAKFGFKHVMFEDNYPRGQGDCYTLKHAFHPDNHHETISGIADKDLLRKIISIYGEFPPIMKLDKNRWGLPWITYESDPPLLEEVKQEFQKLFLQDASGYTWINYIQLGEF
jgi:hypothetical protein